MPSSAALFAALTGIVLASPAAGAEQGAIAAASTGEVRITASVAPRAAIAAATDMTLRTVSGSGLAGQEDLCLSTNTASSRLSLTATGSGADGAFVLAPQDGGGTDLAYTAQWQGTVLEPGVPVELAAGTCGTASVTAPAGGAGPDYAGRLDLLVAPI